MAASDGDFGEDVDAAAEAYASLLDARDGFDVVMLGLGGEGHVASIFPSHPRCTTTGPWWRFVTVPSRRRPGSR